MAWGKIKFIQISSIFVSVLGINFCLAFNEHKKIKIIEKIGFREGHYNTIAVSKGMAKADFCEDEELDINLVDDEGNLSLVIGSHISFPRLEKTLHKEAEAPGCDVEFHNQFASKKIEQTIIKKCKNKVVEKRKQIFFADKQKVSYFSEINQKQKVCHYELVSVKEKNK